MANTKGNRKRGVEFWRAAVERLQAGESSADLAAELGIDRRGLYRWRARLGNGVADPAREREAGLRQEVARLKQALADKVLEVDFLRGALHKVEVRKGLMSQIYLCRWEWGAGSHFMDRQLYERE